MSIFRTANLWSSSGQDELARQTTEGLSVTNVHGPPLDQAQVLATWLDVGTGNKNAGISQADNMKGRGILAIHQYNDVIAVVLRQHATHVTHLFMVEWTKKAGCHCHDHPSVFI